MQKIDIKQIIKNTLRSDFYMNSGVYLGYMDGLPMLQVVNGKLCMLIPLLKYKITGEVDKTLVYPIRYTFRVTLPDGKIVGYEECSVNPAFAEVDFEKPIGFFRHESVKQYTKQQFMEEKDKLYGMYGKMAGAILYGTPYSEEEDEAFKTLLNIILEPSLKPIYEVLDKDFYEKYLA